MKQGLPYGKQFVLSVSYRKEFYELLRKLVSKQKIILIQTYSNNTSLRDINKSIPHGTICAAFHCTKHSKIICDICGSVSYCCIDHLKKHAPNHQRCSQAYITRIFDEVADDNQFAKTICTALYETKLVEPTSLPTLPVEGINNSQLSILLCGASSSYE